MSSLPPKIGPHHPWDREAQRTILAIYLAALEDLVSGASHLLPPTSQLPEWARREFELASTRTYRNQAEYVEELDEVLAEARQRFAECIESVSSAA